MHSREQAGIEFSRQILMMLQWALNTLGIRMLAIDFDDTIFDTQELFEIVNRTYAATVARQFRQHGIEIQDEDLYQRVEYYDTQAFQAGKIVPKQKWDWVVEQLAQEYIGMFPGDDTRSENIRTVIAEHRKIFDQPYVTVPTVQNIVLNTLIALTACNGADGEPLRVVGYTLSDAKWARQKRKALEELGVHLLGLSIVEPPDEKTPERLGKLIDQYCEAREQAMVFGDSPSRDAGAGVLAGALALWLKNGYPIHGNQIVVPEGVVTVDKFQGLIPAIIALGMVKAGEKMWAVEESDL